MIKFDANRIKTLREVHKLSLEEVGEKLGKSKQQVSIWENGVNYPSLENLIHVCNVFDVPLDFFVYDVSTTVDDKKEH